MSERISKIMECTGYAMSEMRKGNRNEIATETALIWINRLGPIERAWLLSVATKAAPESVFDQMIFDNGDLVSLGDINAITD